MNLERSFGFLVQDISRLFARRFDARAKAVLGLTRTQCRLLGHLARNEGIHQAGLAELLEIRPMTLVRQIDRMAEDGWIERQPDPRDRRARRLVLTEKARPIISGIVHVSHEVRGEAFAGLAGAEGEDLLDLLRRVRANLAAPMAAPPNATAADGGAKAAAPARPRAAAELELTEGRP